MLADHQPPWFFDVPAMEVPRRGVYYVHALPASRVAPVSITGERAGDIDLVQVRGSDGDAYGRVHLRRDDDGTRVVVEPGKQRWLVRAGEDWARADVVVEAGVPVQVGGFQPGARASGTVFDLRLGDERPVGPGHRLLFFRVEDDRRLLGEELDVAVLPGGQYDARVPSGTYDVRVMRPHGPLSDPVRVEVRPGMTLSRDFETDVE